MSHVRAALMTRPHGPIDIRDIPEPELEEGSALMKVEYSEVCGTDVHLREGLLEGVPYPIIPGHVSVGHLDKIRGTLLDVNGRQFQEGDRVTFLDVHRTCHACWHCLVAKASTRCPDRKVYGITYGIDDGLTGGWAQAIYLKPGIRVISLENVDFRRFMAGGCGLPTALHAVDRAEVAIGDTVLVLGCGPVGLSSIIFAKMSGALNVLCIGAPDSRLEVASKVGACAVLNFEKHDETARKEWILEHTGGRGADITIEATGAPRAVLQSMHYTRDAGRVVVVGQYTDRGGVEINPHLDLNKKHLDIRGCWGSDFSHFYRGAQIMADETLSAPWDHVGLNPYKLDDMERALDDVARGRVAKALVDPR